MHPTKWQLAELAEKLDDLRERVELIEELINNERLDLEFNCAEDEQSRLLRIHSR